MGDLGEGGRTGKSARPNQGVIFSLGGGCVCVQQAGRGGAVFGLTPTLQGDVMRSIDQPSVEEAGRERRRNT